MFQRTCVLRILPGKSTEIVNGGGDMSGIEMMFRQQMQFQKQQNEQLQAFQQQQATAQAEFQKRMMAFMKSES